MRENASKSMGSSVDIHRMVAVSHLKMGPRTRDSAAYRSTPASVDVATGNHCRLMWDDDMRKDTRRAGEQARSPSDEGGHRRGGGSAQVYLPLRCSGARCSTGKEEAGGGLARATVNKRATTELVVVAILLLLLLL